MTMSDALTADGNMSPKNAEEYKPFDMRLLFIFLMLISAPVVFVYTIAAVVSSHEEAIQIISSQTFLAIELSYCLFAAAIVYVYG